MKIYEKLIGKFHQKNREMVKVEYKNFSNHSNDFPKIQGLTVSKKNGIILLDFFHKNEYINITDEVGFDKDGDYISIHWGVWYNKITGYRVPKEVIEHDGYSSWELYEYTTCTIKIYGRDNRKRFACYVESTETNHKINLIPYDLLHFKNGQNIEIQEIIFD